MYTIPPEKMVDVRVLASGAWLRHRWHGRASPNSHAGSARW